MDVYLWWRSESSGWFDEVTHLPILTSLGAKEGLHNDVIISILEDKMGRLWLVNADGLSCYDYQSDRIQHFDNSDGFLMSSLRNLLRL